MAELVNVRLAVVLDGGESVVCDGENVPMGVGSYSAHDGKVRESGVVLWRGEEARRRGEPELEIRFTWAEWEKLVALAGVQERL
jgi:hypothetical protein